MGPAGGSPLHPLVLQLSEAAQAAVASASVSLGLE